MQNLKLANQTMPSGLPGALAAVRPILVSNATARAYVDVGATTWWKWKKLGLIETVTVAGREMIVFASLERLAQKVA